MKKLIVFSISLLFGGCFTNRQIVEEGKYCYKNAYGVAYKIDFYSDKTFLFEWRNGLNTGIIKGTYKKNGNATVLNGGSTPPKQLIDVEETSTRYSDSIYFEIKDFENNPVPFAVITLDNGQYTHTDTNGKMTINRTTDIAKIKIGYPKSPNLPEYKVHQKKSNQFRIQIYTSLNDEIYLKNVKVRKKKGNKLIMKDNPFSEGSIIFEKTNCIEVEAK